MLTLALVLLLLAMLFVDWRQTPRIFATGRRELNPVIRWAWERWGVPGIDGYFLACGAGALLLDAFASWAWMVLAPITLIQAGFVAHNFRLGIKP